MFALRPSQWRYDTGATGGLGVGMLIASCGTIFLRDPGDHEQQFHYGGCGIGLGGTWRIPKLPDIRLPKLLSRPREAAGTGSTTSFSSDGSVYMTNTFRGEELKRSDLAGGTIYIDAGVGIIADGYGASVMLLGLNSALLMAGITMPQLPFFKLAVSQAKAVLVMRGFNVGLQAGALKNGALQGGVGLGAGVLIGYIH